jgi:hypothetical protein
MTPRLRITDSNGKNYLYEGTLDEWRAENPHREPTNYEHDQLRASIIEACAMSDDDLVRQQDSERQAKAAAIAASYNA